ncbi:MAG TPA: LON peptidase substrate-binding domain-containing protein [Phycisphaerales bacterium]|nr:LON peptidase substrate-binding domain-containing protein [Phycisphaerales bacterium]
MSEIVRVNFGAPMPLFPLPEAVLLPHAVQPLQIFEPRYSKMISDCLDTSGQIAMATFASAHGMRCCAPPSHKIRPAVCIGHIVKHESLPDGCHNILLHGLCRARITHTIESEADRPYRMVKLSPIEPLQDEPPALPHIRSDLKCMLSNPRLQRMQTISTVMQWVNRKDVPTHALLELIGFVLVHDQEVKYRLLEEADILARAGIIRTEIRHIDDLIRAADRQDYRNWPKGMSWN